MAMAIIGYCSDSFAGANVNMESNCFQQVTGRTVLGSWGLFSGDLLEVFIICS
jgi:hypothetical protein